MFVGGFVVDMFRDKHTPFLETIAFFKKDRLNIAAVLISHFGLSSCVNLKLCCHMVPSIQP